MPDLKITAVAAPVRIDVRHEAMMYGRELLANIEKSKKYDPDYKFTVAELAMLVDKTLELMRKECIESIRNTGK